jgi:dihydroorotase
VVPDSLPYPETSLIPFMAGETLNWKLDPDG